MRRSILESRRGRSVRRRLGTSKRADDTRATAASLDVEVGGLEILRVHRLFRARRVGAPRCGVGGTRGARSWTSGLGFAKPRSTHPYIRSRVEGTHQQHHDHRKDDRHVIPLPARSTPDPTATSRNGAHSRRPRWIPRPVPRRYLPRGRLVNPLITRVPPRTARDTTLGRDVSRASIPRRREDLPGTLNVPRRRHERGRATARPPRP